MAEKRLPVIVPPGRAVHPELVPYLGQLRPFSNPYEDIEATRERFLGLLALSPADRTGVSSARYDIARPDGSALTVEVYRPERTGSAEGAEGPAGEDPLPAVLHFHGGGYAIGRSLPGQDRSAIALCRDLPAIVVTVEYRLAPEHRYPAGVEDCYLALEWAAKQAGELGIDADRIAVTGNSAGGGLSAAVALMARDRGGPALVYQSMCVPDVDDRAAEQPIPAVMEDAGAGSGADAPPNPWLNSLRTVRLVWQHYLPEGTTVPDAYASPARATDLSGLPPAYVMVCDLDPLRDTGLAYARRLMDAGVPVTVRNVPGAWHGFELHAPGTRLARETKAHWRDHVRSALYPEPAEGAGAEA
ncbi:esterase [Streptomyces nigrescens]|uniref:Esterase n=2 Tax=Streptomyces TaxID=1883 RepID=A0ABN6R3X9_STRNI|nr:alpha/beta hydrolase [Streptomyces nigrescens]MEE4422549.1 alpha/beta hydrolase [Streptomyces sp. DSM 41528]BDM73147.1 esterase [Streptomyces nigrescens]